MHTIDIDLSTKGLNEAIKYLEKYTNTLPSKLKEMEKRLMLIGIKVARQDTIDIEGIDTKCLIDFKQDFKTTNYGCVGILIEYDIQPIISRWFRGGEIVSAEVSPSLMLEYGSGHHAAEGHQGTFPGQKHAKDVDGWYWKDENGELHHSDGIYPTHPMYNAFCEMENNVITVIKEVFGNG